MISLDTSVVVRYMVGSPADQAARAGGLIDGQAEIGVSLVVLAETVHVLRSNYEITRSNIVEGLIELLSKSNVAPLEISKADAIDALVRARAFESVPITDALIAASAKAYRALPVYTFDKKFGRIGAATATP